MKIRTEDGQDVQFRRTAHARAAFEFVYEDDRHEAVGIPLSRSALEALVRQAQTLLAKGSMTMTTDPNPGDLVEYWNGYEHTRAKVARMTASRVTLENGKVFSRRKFGRVWDFDAVTQATLDYEAKHTAWLDTKPRGRVVTKYDKRMGISVEVYIEPEHIDEVCAELQAIKAWVAAEPKEPR